MNKYSFKQLTNTTLIKPKVGQIIMPQTMEEFEIAKQVFGRGIFGKIFFNNINKLIIKK